MSCFCRTKATPILLMLFFSKMFTNFGIVKNFKMFIILRSSVPHFIPLKTMWTKIRCHKMQLLIKVHIDCTKTRHLCWNQNFEWTCQTNQMVIFHNRTLALIGWWFCPSIRCFFLTAHLSISPSPSLSL